MTDLSHAQVAQVSPVQTKKLRPRDLVLSKRVTVFGEAYALQPLSHLIN